jgi:hypothetical protein
MVLKISVLGCTVSKIKILIEVRIDGSLFNIFESINLILIEVGWTVVDVQ